ncbi:hypothetical protein OIV53_31290, partial [Burkholderia pseudomallei]|nr:hypothetical protein [Burkholderia pseudomallei]
MQPSPGEIYGGSEEKDEEEGGNEPDDARGPTGNANTPAAGKPQTGNSRTGDHVTADGKPTENMLDVKLNTKVSGEAVHLNIDLQTQHYTGSGNSVGIIDKDGKVKLNSGATKELERLET